MGFNECFGVLVFLCFGGASLLAFMVLSILGLEVDEGFRVQYADRHYTLKARNNPKTPRATHPKTPKHKNTKKHKKMPLTHLDSQGNASMVDTGEKQVSRRSATARSIVVLPEEVLAQLSDGATLQSAKGSVFQTAILAGIMAAKKTGDLIPLCHPLGLDHCHIDIQLNENQEVVIDCTARITAKTGVEMEALVGASIAALTVYDMCKALSHDIVIRETRLMAKTGGKRDFSRL